MGRRAKRGGGGEIWSFLMISLSFTDASVNYITTKQKFSGCIKKQRTKQRQEFIQGRVCSHSELVAQASSLEARNWRPRALIWMSGMWFQISPLKGTVTRQLGVLIGPD